LKTTRRGFLKALAAIVPAVAAGRLIKEQPPPMPKPEKGWFRGNTIDSKRVGNVWTSPNSQGAYLYSERLAKQLRDEVSPLVKFEKFARIK